MTASGWWVGWYSDVPLNEFELHSPWWISGYDADNNETMVAAVRAESEEAARAQVLAAYDNPPEGMRWRFCEEIPSDRQPFSEKWSDRWPRNHNVWMAWDEQGTCMCVEKHGGPR